MTTHTEALAVLMVDDGPRHVRPAAHTLTPAEPFEPGLPRMVSELGGSRITPKWQDIIAERDRAGESADVGPQSWRDLVNAALASEAAGVPVLSGSKWMGHDESLVRGTGSATHDPLSGRYRYSRLPQILERVAAAIEETPTGRNRVANGLTGVMQVRMSLLLVGGEPTRRNIHAGARLDDSDRAALRRAKKAGRKAMAPPQRKPFIVTEFHPVKAGRIADIAAGWGGIISARGVIACHLEVEELAFEFAPRGWLHPPQRPGKGWVARAKREGSEGEMAKGDWLNGWGEIATHLGVSERTAQRLKARGLPLRDGLSGGVSARKDELDAWEAKQRKLRATAWNEPSEPKIVP